MNESFVVMRNVHKFLPSVGVELAIIALLYPHFCWDGLRTKDTHKYAKYMNV